MSNDQNSFVVNGFETRWDDQTITIRELGFRHKAVFDSSGNMLSSTFGERGEKFVKDYYQKVRPVVDRMRAIDKEYMDGNGTEQS